MNREDWDTLNTIHNGIKKRLNDKQIKACSFLSKLVEESLTPLFTNAEIVKLINPSYKKVLLKSSIMTILLNESQDIDSACALLNEVRQEIEKTDRMINQNH